MARIIVKMHHCRLHILTHFVLLVYHFPFTKKMHREYIMMDNLQKL